MKEIIMNATWLTTLILAVVGIAKLPFKKFKEKCKLGYRAVFYTLSLILVITGSLVVCKFLLNAPIFSEKFIQLLFGTATGVFGGYTAYEGTCLKDLINKIVESIKAWKKNYSDSKIVKMIDKVGIEKINALAEAMIPKAETITLISPSIGTSNVDSSNQ